MKASKVFILGLALVIGFVLLSGCNKTTSKSYTFNVDTGDKIQIKLNTSDGFDLTQDEGKFTVSKDDSKILHGSFLLEKGYKNFLAEKEKGSFDILDESEQDGNKYYMFKEKANPNKIGIIVMVDDSDTAVLINAGSDEKKAKEAFEKLTISKE